jgi:PAS domain-containing protein
VDTQRRILKWNAGASSLTGFSDRDVLGHYCYDNILMQSTAVELNCASANVLSRRRWTMVKAGKPPST